MASVFFAMLATRASPPDFSTWTLVELPVVFVPPLGLVRARTHYDFPESR